eukprot:TRINITY_DN781964_c0_g1_i1.p1 TRINITY_DN781964_c0_g1~~TRINITY_DN781964_c0_g1_i1.p1  ORF type:complete len:258 (-),score=68.93 TRINITY_DN781964_c0_g1_i1:40-813(-)
MKKFEYQAGGHAEVAGEAPAFFIPDGFEGCVAKKLLRSSEKDFYEHTLVESPELLELCPKCHGVMEHMGFDYAVIEDLTFNMTNPTLIDMKLGQRTWAPGATAKKIENEERKASLSTIAKHGFRVVAMMVYDSEKQDKIHYSRKWGAQLSIEEVEKALGGVFTDSVTGQVKTNVLSKILKKVCEVEDFFIKQNKFIFYGSSLLITFENGVEDEEVRLKMIDFPYVIDAEGKKDEGYMTGLTSIKRILSTILDSDLEE